MAAKKADKDRRAKVAEMQRQARAAERRRTTLIVGSAVGVVALIAGAVTFVIVRDPSRVPGGSLTSLGVPATKAGCDPVTTDKAAAGEHVGPGTSKATVSKVDYSTVPPTTGQHFASPVTPNSSSFYTADDRPKVESLLHNMEHGFTVLWYADSATTAQIANLKAVAREANASKAAKNAFIVTAWDTAYGAFPAGKRFALSHWSADPKDTTKQSGNRQLCADLSGEVVQKFITAYPTSRSPEGAAG